MTEQRELTAGALSAEVDAGRDGQRLDKALEALLPEAGLRLRRRLIESGRVLLAGRPATPGTRVRQGQALELLPGTEPAEAAPLAIAAQSADFAALVKPAGMHSAAICGVAGDSVEARLPDMFPAQSPSLLNRLDCLTSGLVIVALQPAAAQAYAALDPLTMVKEYVAVVAGELAEPLELKRRLDTDDRRRTRVLGRLDPDRRHWTFVWPEEALPGGRTLVRVRIHAGARHQIRAHLAAAGLPILGDPLYAGPDCAAPRLYLHHRRLAFARFEAEAAVDWELPSV